MKCVVCELKMPNIQGFTGSPDFWNSPWWNHLLWRRGLLVSKCLSDPDHHHFHRLTSECYFSSQKGADGEIRRKWEILLSGIVDILKFIPGAEGHAFLRGSPLLVVTTCAETCNADTTKHLALKSNFRSKLCETQGAIF